MEEKQLDIEVQTITARELVQRCHEASKRNNWWAGGIQPHTVPVKLALAHSELSEALEADRKDLMDSHLPNRPGIEVELGDAVVRIFDLAEALGLDIIGAMLDKMAYNAHRANHKPTNRAKKGGKKY